MDHISVIFGAIFLKLTLAMYLASVFPGNDPDNGDCAGGLSPPAPKVGGFWEIKLIFKSF